MSAETASETVFALDKARLGYGGGTVLHEVSFTVHAGERVALVGHSGVGKSTLLGALQAQEPAGTALIPQDTALVKPLSVFHNVYMGRLDRHAGLYNLVNLVRPWGREVALVQAVVTRLGLADKLWSPVGELSGGQQQRTAIARALFQGGRVLLGDEPVSAVDLLQARDILSAINEDFPTVVLAMHDLELAIAFMDRIVALKGGRIVLDQPTAGMQPSDLDGIYLREEGARGAGAAQTGAGA